MKVCVHHISARSSLSLSERV